MLAKVQEKTSYLREEVTDQDIAGNSQWIIARAHQMGLATYGEFVATPYSVGVDAGVDVLVHMGRYELGVIPDELQQPLVEDSEGPASATAYDYAERLPPADLHLRNYARFLATHHAALMPAFSIYYAQLPEHRNLWKEPAAKLLNPSRVYEPTDRSTGEMDYPLLLSSVIRHLPGIDAALDGREPAQKSQPIGAAALADQRGFFPGRPALSGRLWRSGLRLPAGHLAAYGIGTAGSPGTQSARGPGRRHQQLQPATGLERTGIDRSRPPRRYSGIGC